MRINRQCRLPKLCATNCRSGYLSQPCAHPPQPSTTIRVSRPLEQELDVLEYTHRYPSLKP